MRFAYLPLLVLALPLAGCGDLLSSSVHAAPITISMGGSSMVNGDVGVTAGGIRLDPKQPTLFYGTVLERGERRYTYLVIGPPLALGPERSSRNDYQVSHEAGLLESTHEFDSGHARLSAHFTASADPASQALSEQVLQLQGAEVKPGDGWCFLFDFEQGQARLTPVEVEMPRVPASEDDLRGFTAMFAADLARRDSRVEAFVER